MVMVVRRRRRRNMGFTHPNVFRPNRGTADGGKSLHTLRLGGAGAEF
jgi:hypothetical protein